MAKETAITIETSSLLILQARTSARAWCAQCAAEQEMIALENIGLISNLDRKALEDWLNSSALHQAESADGTPLICLHSLLAHVHNAKPGSAA